MKLSGFLALAGDSDQPFRTGAQSCTWQEAIRQIETLAAVWREQGIRQVALYCEHADHFAVALLSCVVGQVDVCIPANLHSENRAWLEQTADVLLSDLPKQEGKQSQVPVLSFQEVLSKPVSPPTSCHYLDFKNNIQLSLQTSGSSGQAKVIQKTWFQMLKEAQTLLCKLPPETLTTPVVVLGSVSQQHLYGLSFRIVLSLLAGWRINNERWVYPEGLLEASAETAGHKVVWVSSPALLHALNDQHDFSDIKDKVLLVISSGGALNDHKKTWLTQKLACPVLEIYGSTETGIVAYRNEALHWQFFDAVRHQEVPDVGLKIESPWCEPSQLLADAIAWHAQGFELLGRVDRIIKLADKRISLLQMEACLLSHPWISDAYVAKHPQASHLAAWVALNQEGVAFWLRHGRKAMIATLKNHLSGKQDSVALPRYWRFDTKLPRNSQSKLTKQDFDQVVLYPIQLPIILDEEQVNEHEYIFRARVPIDLQYFKGHFDAFHLVPGVVQLKWVLAALTRITWLQEQNPRQWENLKFQHFLRPDDVFELRLKRDLAKGKISFQCTDGSAKIASGRFVIPDNTEVS